jgi:uncharacterized protein YbcI
VTAQRATQTPGRTPTPGARREILVAACNALASIHREVFGRGPTATRAYWMDGDGLVVVMYGGFTIAEDLLHGAGRGAEVVCARMVVEDQIEPRMRAEIERLVGRRVAAVLHSCRRDPDVSMEAFLLAPHEPG